MNLNEYQERVEDTWIKNNYDLERIVLGICGESGEIAEKFKKYFRGDKEGWIHSEAKEEISKEIGDVLYYLAKLCNQLEISLEETLQKNINKLAKRKQERKLKGSGDNR